MDIKDWVRRNAFVILCLLVLGIIAYLIWDYLTKPNDEEKRSMWKVADYSLIVFMSLLFIQNLSAIFGYHIDLGPFGIALITLIVPLNGILIGMKGVGWIK